MKHLIAGAGPAGVIAAETIRKLSPSDSITIIGNEPHPPYSRMALPYLLAGDIGEQGAYLRHRDDHFDNLNISILQGSVAEVAPGESSVVLEDGERLTYDRLLLATGSSAIRPPIPGMDLPQVHNCWTMEDGVRILKQMKSGDRVVLLGAGFIGCIVLQALAEMGLELTVVELEDRMLARMMDDVGGSMIGRWCESKGVNVRVGARAVGVEPVGGAVALSLEDGTRIEADHIVCAAGVRSNFDYLSGSGIETDTGILVNYQLETSIEGIYAAGDVAQGPDMSTGERQVHAIQPTASEHGRIAAMQMAGCGSGYGGSLSMNVLNTLGLITSSFGAWDGVDGGDRASAVDTAHNRYLRLEFKDDVLVGSLAVGLTQHVGVLRGLIQTKVKLGSWKKRLMSDPSQVMSAYLAQVQGSR